MAFYSMSSLLFTKYISFFFYHIGLLTNLVNLLQNMLPIDFKRTCTEERFTHTFGTLLSQETFYLKEEDNWTFFPLLFKTFSIEKVVMSFTAFSSLSSQRFIFWMEFLDKLFSYWVLFSKVSFTTSSWTWVLRKAAMS